MASPPRPGHRAAFYRESGIRRAGELRAGAPLRAIQAALQTEHGERVSLDAIARMVREAA